jgi:hypothetical protein
VTIAAAPAAPTPEPAPPPPEPEQPAAELDAPTQKLLADAIAKAVAGQLGRVRISSVPPEAPRSSIRAAADASTRATHIGLAVLGGASIAAEFVAEHWPHAVGPLRALGRVLLKLLEAWVGAS